MENNENNKKNKENNAVSEMFEVSIQKIKELSDTNTVVGEAITTPDGTTLIPVSKVSVGIIGGGCDPIPSKKQDVKNGFGGGIGTAVRIEPVAFLIVKDGHVRMMNFAPTPSTPFDRILDTVPEIMDKVNSIMNPEEKQSEKSDAGQDE